MSIFEHIFVGRKNLKKPGDSVNNLHILEGWILRSNLFKGTLNKIL